MKHFGMVLPEGNVIKNLSVDSGTEFPLLPNDGELFYHLSIDRLYVYSEARWKPVLSDISDGLIDTGWRDIISDITVRGTGSGSPTWTKMGNSPFWGYVFTVGKECWTTFHINHDYKPNGNIHLHVHWTSSGTDTRPIVWQFEYAITKGHNQASGGTFPLANTPFVTGTETLSVNPSGTPWRHMVSELTNSIITTNAEPDSLILIRLSRITNGAVDNTDNIFALTIDCHYQADRFATINKSPIFYS